MNFLCRVTRRVKYLAGAALVAGWLAGCGTFDNPAPPSDPAQRPKPTNDAPSADRLRAGDKVAVYFADIPNPPPPYLLTIRDDGSIVLHLNLTFTAAGKRASDLEREIYERYVPEYYKRLTVSVKTEDRFFFVDGEVKAPGPKPFLGEMDVLKAISAAQGFTEWANKKKVDVTRANGEKFRVNCTKARSDASENRPIYPGDSVFVHRRGPI